MRTQASFAGRHSIAEVPKHRLKILYVRDVKKRPSGQMRLTAIGVLTAAALTASRSAQAQTATLFTTQDDFSGWTASGPSVSVGPSSTYDFDGSTTNGYGNTTNAGGAAVMGAGSLQINTGSNAIGYTTVAASPDKHNNQLFMS